MPVLNWDEQDLSRRQDAGQEWGLSKLGELLQVRMLHVHLKRTQESPAQPPEMGRVGEKLRCPPGSCCGEGACHEDIEPLTPVGNTAGCTSFQSPGGQRPHQSVSWLVASLHTSCRSLSPLPPLPLRAAPCTAPWPSGPPAPPHVLEVPPCFPRSLTNR